MRNKKTSDSYEAAFYIMYGAQFEKLRTRYLSPKKAQYSGYIKQWTIYLSNVPDFAIRGWNEGITYGDIQKFKKARLKLKKLLTSKR